MTMLGFGQAAPDPWLILDSGERGPINVHTTREDLVRTFGAANVVDQDVDIDEGEIVVGTFLFPKDPGTDMAQELISWRGGLLEKEFQGDGRVILSLEYSPAKGAKQRGPSDFSRDSDSPAMRAQNPHISEINWVFPSKTQP
jgi:hypothetical protein